MLWHLGPLYYHYHSLYKNLLYYDGDSRGLSFQCHNQTKI